MEAYPLKQLKDTHLMAGNKYDLACDMLAIVTLQVLYNRRD